MDSILIQSLRKPRRAASGWPSVRSGRALPAVRPPGVRERGSTITQAILLSSVAAFGVMAMATRLSESRYSGFTRSDSLSAREAAEYGLNELQSTLNSSRYSYLLVTKRDAWDDTTLSAALDACKVPVLDESGAKITTPTLPAGVSSEKEIKNSNGEKITYRLVDYTPPALPNPTDPAVTAQAESCGNATAAEHFGNLTGGSAMITVEGKVERQDRVETTFRMRRTTHVVNPTGQLAYGFIILGDAYELSSTNKFGDKDDIARLNRTNGNICYGTLATTSCLTNPPLPKTTIGCYNLASCIANNFDAASTSNLSKYCQDLKVAGVKRRGYTCNEFQQIGELPPPITPQSEGMIVNNLAYSNANWAQKATKIDKCDVKDITLTSGVKVKDWVCEVKNNSNNTIISNLRTKFPYKHDAFVGIASKAGVLTLTNADLVPGCYFNNVESIATSRASNTSTTAINCLLGKFKIEGDKAAGLPNLVVHTTKVLGDGSTTALLPVNIFLHGTDEILLEKGGIHNSDTSDLGWSRLRLIGKFVPPAAGQSVSCSQSSRIKSKNGNDLSNVFVWLPNAALIYDRDSSLDNSYAVIWACQFIGPKEKGGEKYSIVTPLAESLVRAGLSETVPQFGSSFGSIYRSFGAKDTPV